MQDLIAAAGTSEDEVVSDFRNLRRARRTRKADGVRPQEPSRRPKMLLFNRRPNDDPVSRNVSTEATQCRRLPRDIEHAGADLDRQYGLKLDERQPGNDAIGAGLAHNALYVFRTEFPMVELCESAGIEEIPRHSAFFSRSYNRVRE